MPRPQRHRKRPLRIETLEHRRVLAAGLPLGTTAHDTAEFMLGSVTVTPIFLESDSSVTNQSQNWTEAEIDEVLAKITEGVNWWSDALDQLDTVHSLEFIIDDTYARNPVEIGYEPIDRVSNDYNKYVGDFLDFANIDSSLQIDDGMFEFNNQQRELHGTDWAFSLFIADSSDDADGFFENGGAFRGAFAFAGGLYVVSPSTRPVTTFTHELGHIFWAFDEYAGGADYDDTRGYYDSPNSNAVVNPTRVGDQEISIMASFDLLVAAYSAQTSPASTFALIGWQDSDGDGVFDVLDVPLNLQGSGGFNAETSQFQFNGSASVGTLPNRNSSGRQSDITLNEVSRLEVSIDNGNWMTIAEPNAYTAAFDLAVDVPANFSTIALRVIDAETGITSDVWNATSTTPLLPPSAPLRGYAFLDTDDDSNRVSGEPLLPEVTINVTAADGSALPSGDYDAADVPLNSNLVPVDGITITGRLIAFDANVQARTMPLINNQPLFHVFDPQLQVWTANLSNRVSVEATFDEPTSYVEVDVVGMKSGGASYARIEAYDAAGNMLDRATTDVRNDLDGKLSFGEKKTLRLRDASGLIASVSVFGHADSTIGMSAIRTGVSSVWTTDSHGGFVLSDLPPGEYQLNAIAEQVTFGFAPITVNTAAGEPIKLAASLVDSPRHNALLVFDVNEDEEVTAVDALQVINDLNTFGSRTLTRAEILGNKIDVTNDGVVTALDALRVINYLNLLDNLSVPTSEPLAGDGAPNETDTELTSQTVEEDFTGIDEVLSAPIKWVAPSDENTDGEENVLDFLS